jgi:hypothetical protein
MYLLLAAAQHGDDGQTHRLHGECGRPILSEDGQADVSIAVDVRVHRHVGTHKRHLSITFTCSIQSMNSVRQISYLWRIKWISRSKFELQLKILALIQSSIRSFHVHRPPASDSLIKLYFTSASD